MSLSWRSLLGRTAAVSGLASVILAVGIVVGVRIAKADPGGPTRASLTFAGVLRNMDGSAPARTASLTFLFTRSDGVTCAPPAVSASIAAGGAFTVLVPIDGCASTFFDGGNISYTVAEGATMLTTIPVLVTPVPYARFADQAGVANDCPAGYARDTSDTTITATMRLCVRTVSLGGTLVRDEVVKVGSGASAFWVDRYEASVHFTGTGVQLAVSNTTGGVEGLAIETSGLTASGQRPAGNSPAWALSHPGQPTVNITWFQANEACAATGKRLLQREEWFRAASGTVDGAACNVSSGGPRAAAPANGCVSASGAHDMIGNVWEWTSEWYASVGQTTRLDRAGDGGVVLPATSAEVIGERVYAISVNNGIESWPTGYGGDSTWNITSAAENDATGRSYAIPGAALRGGNWTLGSRAGSFTIDVGNAPSGRARTIGFRCVVPR